MAGPWEKYGAQQTDTAPQGPWSKYAQSPQAPSRLKSAIAGAIPGGQSVLASGGSVPERIGAAGGDLLNAALMIGSGGGWGAAKQAALGAGAGAMAPELGKLSEYGSEQGEKLSKYTPMGALAGLIPEDTRSMPLQIARNLPGTIGGVAGAALPQVLLALLGKAGQKVTGASLKPTPAAAALEAQGGQVTAAQSLPRGPVRGVASLLESSARTNPLLEGKFRAIDEANAGAVGEAAKRTFGQDIMQPESAANTGLSLKGALDTIAQKRSEAYQPAAQALKEAKGYTRFGKDIVSAATKAGAENAVLPDVAALWEKNAKRLANAKTPAQVDLEFQNMRHRFDTQYSDLKAANASAYGAAERSFAIMERAAKDAYYDGLNRIEPPQLGQNGEVIKPGLGDQIREAKGDYAQASQAMSPLSKALAQKKGNAPESVGPALARSGSKSIEALLAEADPATRQILQEQLARTLLEGAKTPEGISTARLKSQLNTNRAISPMLGDQNVRIQDLLEMARTAGQENLGLANPSGTAVTLGKFGHAGAAFNPGMWPALLGKMLMDAGYTYGGRPALNVASSGLGAIGKMSPSIPQAAAMGAQGMTKEEALRNALRLSQVK